MKVNSGSGASGAALGVLAAAPASPASPGSSARPLPPTRTVAKTLLLTRWFGDVTLFLDTLSVDDIPDRDWERLAAAGVRVVVGRVDGLVAEGDRVVGVRLASGRTFACSAVDVRPLAPAPGPRAAHPTGRGRRHLSVAS